MICSLRPYLVVVVLSALPFVAIAQTPLPPSPAASPRHLVALSGPGWQFLGAKAKENLPEIASTGFTSGPWTEVSVPHTFQSRGSMETQQGWYRTKINVTEALAHSHLYLVFEGAAAIADVYVNGQHLGQHRGAYTRFVFDATPALHAGADNELTVLVDNRKESTTDCLPNVSGLYTVWGGLYRHVWLLATNDLQIDPTYYASPGVFITPSNLSGQSAAVEVKVLLRNTSTSAQSATVKATILDPKNQVVQTLTGAISVPANQGTPLTLSGTVASPLLWTPATPNLYHVQVEVAAGGQVTDAITQPLGFHNLSWDLKAGRVQLNGQPFVLYGVDLHQEIETKNSAVEPEDLIANFDTMQDLGVNFVRLAHYPHAELEYDLCDQRGIFCWAENGHSHGDKVNPTNDLITTEMVEQNYNHPSIIIWSVGNEGSSGPAQAEVPVVKALDSTRPVMVANMGCANADYRAFNIYPGWYGHNRWGFKPSGLISETGGGGVVTTHCDYANADHKVNSYEPEEYQQLVAETTFQMCFRRDEGKLGMLTWWILREFNDIKYKSSLAYDKQGINSKGLVTYNGDKKDVYYLYRCFLRPTTPTLHITSKRYFLRQGAVDNGIKVYSTAKSVTLSLNGEKVSTVENGQYSQNDPNNKTGSGEVDNVFYWPVPLHSGKNLVTATDDRGNSDSATIYYEGSAGLPELPVSSPLVSNLTSSNPSNPAYYLDLPVQAEWPIYDDFDSTADNSLGPIPSSLQGATWLALKRVTKAEQATEVGFTLTKPATVYVLCTRQESAPAWLTGANFSEVDTGPLSWRGNDLILVPAQLYRKHVSAGESIKLSLGERDALILFKAD